MAARILLILGLFVVLGCGASAENSALTLEELRNSRYPLLGTEKRTEVILSDGEFVGESTRTRALLGENWIARGDLNRDGREDVAVVLYFDTGGSGNFREFIVLTAREGRPEVLGGILAGDRLRIEAFEIVDHLLLVVMLTHSEEDPMCCPTLRVRDRYTLQDGELIRISREELERAEP